MHKSETHCQELTGKTAVAINNNILKQLFVTVQNNNLKVCMKHCIDIGYRLRGRLLDALRGTNHCSLLNKDLLPPTKSSISMFVAHCFPHICSYSGYLIM